MPILIILILLLAIRIEKPETTLKKIKEKQSQIELAAKLFSVKTEYLSAIIFAERTLNYTWEDDALDVLFANAGLNSSIGFCQVKMKTAYWIELQLEDEASRFFPGRKYKNILSESKSKEEIIKKLVNDSLNILYAAAYLRIIISRWEAEKFSIEEKPEIQATLYSTGIFKTDGSERKPNKNPQVNRFGLKVLEAIRKLYYGKR